MELFIELWKAKDTWKALSVSDRQNYVAQIGPVMQDLIEKGVVIEAWGLNDDESNYRAGFDFFAVAKFPSTELLNEFKNIVEAAHWYDYFEQVNVSGTAMSPEEVIGKLIAL